METLIESYIQILKGLNARAFNLREDKYSGVFLPIPHEEYCRSPVKIMLIGRETAGWNTLNNKNTISRVLGHMPNIDVEHVVEEAVTRYRKHQKEVALNLKSRSRFTQYHCLLARKLGIPPQAIMYANLFAWDYDRKTPLDRPSEEREEIITVSLKLLDQQISNLEPNYVIFASGARRTDFIIKSLLKEHLGGYKTSSVISGKLWEFQTKSATCFRIAHPRAMHGHQEYRKEVIKRIKQAIID